jgi:hypothetical protein
MSDANIPTEKETLTEASVSVDGVPTPLVQELTLREITLAESLLTPGLQTSLKFHNYIHRPIKNLDQFKGKNINIEVKRDILEKYGLPSILKTTQRIYRLDNRKLINNNNEEYILHACDDTLLNDARNLVSKSWKCTGPTYIVTDVLANCAGASKIDASEMATPIRDYIAENIHPFQVVTQQANAALAGGSDPSFLHFMTYDINGGAGIHHFRSLKSLTSQEPVISRDTPFTYQETGSITGYGNPLSIISYSFPCDFDLLSDILNGVDLNGQVINAVTTTNPLTSQVSLFGNQALGCGLGGGNYYVSKTNLSSESQQDSCRFDVEQYLQKRQARMGLLEQDKVALRLTVPWSPILHAGSVIVIHLIRKEGESTDYPLYGSGVYLVSSLIHNIKNGGYSTTTMDCVAQTAGQGVV